MELSRFKHRERRKSNTGLPEEKPTDNISSSKGCCLQESCPPNIAGLYSTLWDPYTQQKIDKIEMVQRRAARYTLNR